MELQELLNTLFESIPHPFSKFLQENYPWQLLYSINDFLTTNTIDVPIPDGVTIVGDRIQISQGAVIQPGATIEGPVFIGKGAIIKNGSYIRGGCWIGNNAVVGINCEIKHSIIFPRAKIPHLSYVGDSIIGNDVNLGAGTILANLRHDNKNVYINLKGKRIDTKLRKLGAIVGDKVKTGCNCVLSPGVIIGKGTHIYPLTHLPPKFYPPNKILKSVARITILEKRG